MANPFVHVELSTTDIDKAKSFYRSLFAWQLDDMEMGGGMTYTLIRVGEGTGGGMMKHPVAGEPSAWLPHVQVDDIRAATDKAKSLGATLVRDVTPVTDEGSLRSSSTRPAQCSGSGSKTANRPGAAGSRRAGGADWAGPIRFKRVVAAPSAKGRFAVRRRTLPAGRVPSTAGCPRSGRVIASGKTRLAATMPGSCGSRMRRRLL
jgi:predicted enzyme related to lactoylglutathione lyase